jgi:predicted ATPase
MLSRLNLAGLRACVDSTTLELGPLTVLAGANNAGKSTFVGALLALVQSQQAASRHRLLLSGEWVDLGPFHEILSPGCDAFSIGIEGQLDSMELSVLWDFVEEPDRRTRAEARLAKIDAVLGGELVTIEVGANGTVVGPQPMQLLHPAAALRIGQSELRFLPHLADQVVAVGPYRAPPEQLSPFRTRADGSLVGRYGQYAAEAFWQKQDHETDVLPPEVSGTETVARAMNAWWSYILRDDIVLKVSQETRFGFSVRLDTSGVFDRSLGQVGFGLSQLWPILVACLGSQPGDLVIVETPEAHLHPGAQHRLADLFVALARRGRQVIVETHSEHVVAAACLATKKEQLEPSQLALSFFAQTQGRTQIERIAVDRTGRRLAAPEGFFDQSAQELLELLSP